MEQSTINYQNRQKIFWKSLRIQVTIFYIVKRERGLTPVSGSLCCIRTYFFCAHRRIRSSKHGWNKPWLAKLLVIRTTKRGPVACRPNRTGIFCKHVIVNTRRNGALKCSSSNPPRGYAVSISEQNVSSEREWLKWESRSILERKESLFAGQWACYACNEPKRTNDGRSSLFFDVIINLHYIFI